MTAHIQTHSLDGLGKSQAPEASPYKPCAYSRGLAQAQGKCTEGPLLLQCQLSPGDTAKPGGTFQGDCCLEIDLINFHMPLTFISYKFHWSPKEAVPFVHGAHRNLVGPLTTALSPAPPAFPLWKLGYHAYRAAGWILAWCPLVYFITIY